MTEPLKICIIGCGRVAQSHGEGALASEGAVEISAIVSRSDEKRNAFREKFHVPNAYADIDEALASGTFDAVDICLPNYLHADCAVKCAAAGKHILLEKPMANTSAECERINAACHAAGVTLMIGQSRRYHEAVLLSKRLCDEGKIGRVISVTGTLMGYLAAPPTDWWRSSEKAGGLMIPLWGNHILDYILFIFGEMPQRVYCEAYNNNPAWEGEDETTILLGFSDDRFATVRMSWNTRLAPEKKWTGDQKMLASSDILYERFVQGDRGTMRLNDETKLSLNGETVFDNAAAKNNFAAQYREFAASLREGRKPMTDGDSGVGLIRIQEAALESARTHRVIQL
ncbi:MAG: Gfo/Idh/MocA family oxidoreductase [Oscillospiraceae bacterium]|nr:Gfo/Idh/MocA family oxidoreductase [Oscillospiraceae bacterium]